MNKHFWVILLSICITGIQSMFGAAELLTSPNGILKVTVNTTGNVNYAISYGASSYALISASEISMNFNNGIVAGVNGTLSGNVVRTSVNNTINVVVGKNATLEDKYNEMKINYTQGYSIVFRAYDDGIAYRFETNFSQTSIIVNDESANYVFANNPSVYFPILDAGQKLNHWERSYVTYSSISGIGAGRIATCPVLFSFPGTAVKVALLEAGLLDYPGLYIQQKSSNSLKGYWAQYPDQVEDPGDFYSRHYPITRFNYLARTKGTRTYPWRVMAISGNDKSLLNNEIVYKLAEPCRLTNTSWIKPGKSAWEWGSKGLLEGKPFSGTLGLELYKYYVDFASKNKLEFITLDAGWQPDYLPELCAYAAAKNPAVKIIVWTWTSLPVDLPGYMAWIKDMGAYGFKIDFVDRDDQIAINWLETLAQRAADLQAVVVFHGCPPPTGLSRTYPNILNWEAARGQECTRWDSTTSPDYYTQVSFIRMLAGPFDICPGSLQNHTKASFKWNEGGNTPPGNPSSMGTRSYQMALSLTIDQPYLCLIDAATEYEKHPTIMEFYQKVPTVWTKTVPLSAELGQYAVVAKQTGNDWYVGGINNWSKRTVRVDFTFLPEGYDFAATIYRDTPNSSASPKEYVCEKKTVRRTSIMNLEMADGGGFVIMLARGATNGEPNVSLTASSETGAFSPVYEAAAAWGDFNNDGYLDLLTAGMGNVNRETSLYRSNNGDGTFTKVTNPFAAVRAANVTWLDFNNDGNLDVFICGNLGSNTTRTTALYKNLGSGSSYGFQEVFTGQFTNMDNGGGNLPNRYAAAADFDNDGYVDIYVQGMASNRQSILYKNNQGASFSAVQYPVSGTKGFIQMNAGEAVWADLNNDGYMDLIVTGYARATTDYPTLSAGYVGAVYINKGNGTFAEPTLYDGTEQGGLVAGDFNNDGKLDYAVTGVTSVGSWRWPNDIYINNGAGTTFNKLDKTVNGIDVSRQEASLAAGDINNDGWIDLLYSNASDDANSVFLSNGFSGGKVTFTQSNLIAGLCSRAASVCLVDYDNDGTLDIFTTGYANTLKPSAGGYSALYKNKLRSGMPGNQPPSVPANLKHTVNGNGTITFTWDRSTDDHTPQSAIQYNLFVQKTGTNKIMSILPANIESGRLKVNENLAALATNSYTLKGWTLETGDKYGVQAIDGAKSASKFNVYTIPPPIGIDNTKQSSVSWSYVDREDVLNVYSQNNIRNVKVYSVTGQLILNESFGELKNIQKINISNLNKGIYVIEVNTDTRTDVLKFIF